VNVRVINVNDKQYSHLQASSNYSVVARISGITETAPYFCLISHRNLLNFSFNDAAELQFGHFVVTQTYFPAFPADPEQAVLRNCR